MAATVSLYNAALMRFVNGANSPSDSYKVMLCSDAVFDATNSTLASITKTEIAALNGYVSGGAALTNVSVTSTSGGGACFDADDVLFTATASGPITASFGILYNSTQSNSPPILFIDFGGSQTAPAETSLSITWDTTGILSFTPSN